MRFRCVCVLCVSHSDALHRNDEETHPPPYEPTPSSSTGKARGGTNGREDDPIEKGLERRKVQRNAAGEVRGDRRRGGSGNGERSSARDGPFETSYKFEELFFRGVRISEDTRTKKVHFWVPIDPFFYVHPFSWTVRVALGRIRGQVSSKARIHFERCETLPFQLKWGFGTSTAEGVPGRSHVNDLLIRTPRHWGKLQNRLTVRPPLGSIARRGPHLVHRTGPCPFLPFVPSPAEAVLKSTRCPLRRLLVLPPRPPRGYLGEDA